MTEIQQLSESLSMTHKYRQALTYREWPTFMQTGKQMDRQTDKLPDRQTVETDQDFVLPGEVWWLTE